MTADVFPGRSALAVLGGADDVWLNGYRWGWELADNPCDADRDQMRRRRRELEVFEPVGISWATFLRNRWDGMVAGWNDNNGGEF